MKHQVKKRDFSQIRVQATEKKILRFGSIKGYKRLDKILNVRIRQKLNIVSGDQQKEHSHNWWEHSVECMKQHPNNGFEL